MLGHTTGQEMAATLADLFLFHLSVGGGMGVFRAPDAEKWVNGLLTKRVGTNAEAALGAHAEEACAFLSSVHGGGMCPSHKGAH